VRQLRFDGRVEKELTKQTVSTGEHSVEKRYDYDHADRLLNTRYIVKSGLPEMKNIVVAAIRYSSVGQMKQKYLNSTDASKFRQQLDYRYVPRGWMSKVLGRTSAGDNFGIELKYTNTANAQYNGNIGEMSWKRTGSSNWGSYNFTYDKANRLTNAAGTHQELISYDLNGNIKTLNRWIDGSHKDGLTYTYENGNQLSKVTDSQGAEGFNNGNSGNDNDYAYDGNGNATQDKNRNIPENGLQYNILNLPRQIVVDGDTLKYHYDATGSKLRMENPKSTMNTKYAGAFEYNKASYLTRIATEEGQISITNNGASEQDYTFEYYRAATVFVTIWATPAW
jgi:Fe-S cluster assembly iron-binding protein IscA